MAESRRGETPAPLPATTIAPRRADGTPALGVIADTATPWRAKVGEEVTLRIKVSNRGGPVRGLYVEMSGAAVSEKQTQPMSVSTDGKTEVKFVSTSDGARAELPATAIEAGYVAGEVKRSGPATPPPPVITLTVRVRAVKAGQSIMTVRVGPHGATSTTGSAMAGRSFIATAE